MKPANVVSDELSEASQTQPVHSLFYPVHNPLCRTVCNSAQSLHLAHVEALQYQTWAQNTDLGGARCRYYYPPSLLKPFAMQFSSIATTFHQCNILICACPTICTLTKYSAMLYIQCTCDAIHIQSPCVSNCSVVGHSAAWWLQQLS